MQQKTGQGVTHWLDALEQKTDAIAQQREEAILKRLAETLPDIWPPGYAGEPLTEETRRRVLACLTELSPAERSIMRCREADFAHLDLPPGYLAGLDGFPGLAGRKCLIWSETHALNSAVGWHYGYCNE